MTQLSASGSDSGGGAADSRFLKRSAVVKYALRQRANSYDAGSSRNSAPATPAAAAAAAATVEGLRRRPSLPASGGLLADVDMGSTTLASSGGSGGTLSKVDDAGTGGGGSSGDYWYPTLLGLPPRRPKTCGAPNANGLERRLYSMTNAKHGPAAPAPPSRRRGSDGGAGGSAGAERTPASVVGTKETAATSSDRQSRRRPETAAAASHLFWGSSAVPLRSVVGDESGAAVESVTQPTAARSLYAALQTGQCTLECDMSQVVSNGDGVRPDLLPQPLTVVRRHHRDKTLHYGQIKLALSRDQVLEGAAIRDSADGSRPAVADRTGHSLQKLGSLRGSLPNISAAGDGTTPQLQLPAALPRNHHRHHQLRGPLLVSGIFNPTDETQTIAAARGRGGYGDSPRAPVTATAVDDTAPQQTNDTAVAAVAQTAVAGGAALSWQQMLGPQRIPTVTKPPTITAPHPSAPAAGGVSLPQRGRHYSRPGAGVGVGGGLSGGARLHGTGSASSAGAAVSAMRTGPDDAARQDAEPRYVDPFVGAPASMQTRLAEMAVLESETVRWERSGGGKAKKKNGRDRDD